MGELAKQAGLTDATATNEGVFVEPDPMWTPDSEKERPIAPTPKKPRSKKTNEELSVDSSTDQAVSADIMAQYGLEEEERIDDLMTGSMLSFTKPGTGGGGYYGDGRVCVWRNWRMTEHGFVKHGPDGVTVVEEFPPSCMIGVDLYAQRHEDDDDTFKEMVTQWYTAGNLPLARMAEIGWNMQRLQASITKAPGGQKRWQNRTKFPGGIQPSLDGRSPAAEGPFMWSETESGMHVSTTGWLLFSELLNLAAASGEVIEDRLGAQGLACLEGLVSMAGLKDVPKSDKTKKDDEQLINTGRASEVREPKKIVIPVLDENLVWPWKQAAAATTGTTPATPPTQTKKATKPAVATATPAPASTPTATAATPAAPGQVDDYELAAVLVKLLELEPTHSVTRGAGALGLKIMRAPNDARFGELAAKVKANLMPFMARANTAEFLSAFDGVFWQVADINNPASEIKLVVQS